MQGDGISVWENWGPLLGSKPRWEVRLEIQVRNDLRKQAKMVKQKDHGICGKGIEKKTWEKIALQLVEKNPKVLAKEGRLKGKTIETKQDIPKQRKKILSTTGRAWHKYMPITRHQRNRTISDENMATEKV